MNLVHKTLQAGGKIAPIIIPDGYHKGIGYMNPSVLVDKDGDILVNLRHINYALYHNEKDQRFPSLWGPLAYLHPEKDQTLRTINYICRLDADLNLINYTQVDTSEFDVEPLWEFHGLEDARLVEWGGQLFQCGVRRDTTTNGQGRMELSAIRLDKKAWTAKEASRDRLPAPGDDASYCEKNWMPIINIPFTLVKWTSPTEIVQVLYETTTSGPLEGKTAPTDLRGGSQVIPFGKHFIAIVHEVDLYKDYMGRKDGVYRHRLVVWDKDFKLIGVSPTPFSFLDAKIEFCAGMAQLNDTLLITFGYQDNAAFILSMPEEVMNTMVSEALTYDK